MSKEIKDVRSGIISIISTPLQFAALIVLVVEALLGFLLSKAKPDDIALYVIMMVGVLVLTIAAAFFIEYRKIKLKNAIPDTGTQEVQRKNYTWDVFLAAPMAAMADADFERDLQKIKDIKAALETKCGFSRVFFAGTNMKTKADFETSDLSIGKDLDALKESQIFILIYPEKIVSSVLVEVGIALALGKQSYYFGKTDDFPFLMQQANNQFDYVKIYNGKSYDEIYRIIDKNANELFENPSKSKP